jgi:hypothetical protein
MGDAGVGIKNLAGFGSAPGTAEAARAAFTAPITNVGLTGVVMGSTGLMALEEQKKQLESQLAAGNIAQDQYNASMASINEQIETARKAVSDNPLQTSSDLTNVKEGSSLYDKVGIGTLYDKTPVGDETFYAMGGAVNPPDDQTYMPSQTPMQRLENRGVMGYAAGGMPRFLSGGGDGMSDSIKANINGNQEARLADGEFVIPADVVSHLGNGSSKAGAKQLYSMMDKVRQARVGTKKQGKQINPRKYLAA